jgi:hypothetical protein
MLHMTAVLQCVLQAVVEGHRRHSACAHMQTTQQLPVHMAVPWSGGCTCLCALTLHGYVYSKLAGKKPWDNAMSMLANRAYLCLPACPNVRRVHMAGVVSSRQVLMPAFAEHSVLMSPLMQTWRVHKARFAQQAWHTVGCASFDADHPDGTCVAALAD